MRVAVCFGGPSVEHDVSIISAQQLIAAHITEAPAPLDKAKVSIPHQLSQLVMFCLAKDPARRPSASAVRTTLESLGPAAVTSRRRKLVLTIAAGIALLVVTSMPSLG